MQLVSLPQQRGKGESRLKTLAWKCNGGIKRQNIWSMWSKIGTDKFRASETYMKDEENCTKNLDHLFLKLASTHLESLRRTFTI